MWREAEQTLANRLAAGSLRRLRWLRVVGAAVGVLVLTLVLLVLVFAFSGSSPPLVLTPPRYRVSPGPSSAAIDSRGYLWVTYNNGIARVSAKGVVTEFPLSCCIDFGFGGAATGPDGNVSFNDSENIWTVAASGKPRLLSSSWRRLGLPDAMTTGPDGELWFTEEGIPAAIGRITAAGVVTRYRIPTPFGGWVLAGIVVGPDNALWFTEVPFDGGSEAIGRMTTGGRYTRFVLPRVRGKLGPSIAGEGGAIAVGADNALWFTEPLAHRIWRITTAGKITGYRVPTNGDWGGPFGIAAGRHGVLWFTTDTHFGRITPDGRITLWRVAGAREMTDVIPANNGTFWVPDVGANVVFHITPPR